MKYFSMFSGIGGFKVGIKATIPGTKCVGFSETNPYVKSIYQQYFKDHKDYGNATRIKPEALKWVQCLVQ